MLFWSIVAAVVIITALVVANEWDYGYPIGSGILALFVSSFVGLFIWVAGCLFVPAERVPAGEQTYQLKALGNDSALTGRSYFLGGGYIKDKRVLNYITRGESGAIKVDRAYADDSTIYEGADKATLKVTHVDKVNGWISPWPIDSHDFYQFNIPTGSVVESYTLDNK